MAHSRCLPLSRPPQQQQSSTVFAATPPTLMYQRWISTIGSRCEQTSEAGAWWAARFDPSDLALATFGLTKLKNPSLQYGPSRDKITADPACWFHMLRFAADERTFLPCELT